MFYVGGQIWEDDFNYLFKCLLNFCFVLGFLLCIGVIVVGLFDQFLVMWNMEYNEYKQVNKMFLEYSIIGQ